MEVVVRSRKWSPQTLLLIDVLAGVFFRIWKEKVIHANADCADCTSCMQSFQLCK